MTEIRHIVFDVGRVLIHWDPELAYVERIPDPDKRQQFLTVVCSPAWNVEQDRGRSWREAEDLLIAEHPDEEDNIRAFRANWHKMVPHALEDSVAIMCGLMADGHDVTLLTNFASDTFAEAGERFDFLRQTRGATVSAHIGKIKPDREIYDAHVSSFDLTPEATLFVDDSEKNVIGAMQAGWQAVQFIDADTLKRDLASLGIKAA